jgi:lipopolysaccharide transport system permease protein
MSSSKLIHFRDLLSELVQRDMRLRYKRSLLGVLWSLLNPLLQLVVFTFIFGVVLPLNIPHFPLFLFTGLLAWNWFQSSLLEATGAIVDNRELIRRPGFPDAILPLVSVSTNFLHYLLALPVLMVFVAASGIPFRPVLLALPLVLAVQFVITLGLAYLIAALHVRFRDTRYLLGIALLLGFYLSPVFYDAAAIPAAYQAIYRLNPMVTLLEAYRAMLMEGVFPSPLILLAWAVVGALVLLLGVRLFRRMSVHFAEEL